MKNSRPVILGIFIFLGLAIFAIAVFTLGGQKKSFVKTFTVNAVFGDVDGLQAGNNIWYSGVKVGTVKKVSFYNDSEVLVSMNIERSVQSHIRKDAFVKIGADGLIGNKIVVISGGTASAPEIEKGDFLKARTAIGTRELLDTFQQNNRNLLDITKNFKEISRKINTGEGTAGTLINDVELANELKATVNNLRSTITNFKEVSQKSRKVLQNLQDFSAGLNRQGTLVKDLTSDTTVFPSIKNTVTRLKETVDNANRLTDNLKTASDALNKNNNTIGMLLHDSAVAFSFKSTLKNLETSSLKLDEDLEAIQHNFLFRGFFRKKEKTRKQALPGH